MVTRILWLRAFTGYGILVLLGIVGVLWIGMEIVMAIHTKTSSAAKLWTMDIVATVYKGNIIKNLIMDCQSYTKYRPNETTGGIFVSWRRKEELPTGA